MATLTPVFPSFEARTSATEVPANLAEGEVRIEMDTCWAEHLGETLASALESLEFSFQVRATVLVEQGPGGGWPIVQYEGLRDHIESLLREAFDYDDAEITEELDA